MKRWLALLFLLPVLAACSAPVLIPTPTASLPQGSPVPVRLVCSESVMPLFQALSVAYQRVNPAVQLTLVERADALAWEMVERGEVDLAALTMAVPEPGAAGVWTATFARDGLAIVVNPQNGVPGVTMDQLRDLFMGRAEDWEPLGGFPGRPQLLSREDASGDQAFFQATVMESFPVALTAFLLPNSETVLEMVASEPLAVGFLSSARVDDRVRALAIDEMPPAKELLASGVYPLMRPLTFVSIGEPPGAARNFIQWVLGPEGQDIVRGMGWVPAAE